MFPLLLSVAALCSSVLAALGFPSIVKTSGRECYQYGSPCSNGQVCAGPMDHLICVPPMTAGKPCKVDPYWICDTSLLCENHICVIPERGDCFSNEYACVTGTTCAGTANYKRCVRPMKEGDPCGTDPLWICESGLECLNGICSNPSVPAGGSCIEFSDKCIEGTVCAGAQDNMKCVEPMRRGEKCGQDPFWVCDNGLSCNNGVCGDYQIPKGGDCSDSPTCCERGLVCAGGTQIKRCVSPMNENEKCGMDPFWVCNSGLKCVDNLCRKPVVRKGDDCLPEGSVCVSGTVCAGWSDKKRCVVPMSEGKGCGKDPFWVCEDDLDCVEGQCVKPRVPKGGDCLDHDVVCEEGTVCAGTELRRKCVEPMGEGKRCGKDPFWVCEDGLTCYRRVCVPSSGGEGADCRREGFWCDEGLVCAGTVRRRKCVKPVQLMGKCGKRVRRACAQTLSCVNERCVKIVQTGEPCDGTGTICGDKTVCAGAATGNGKCVSPKQEGEACGTDKDWLCAAGMKCLDGKCVTHGVQKGDRCIGEILSCPQGTVCAGDQPSKECVEAIGEGRRCGRRWWQVCGEGLRCEKHRCTYVSS